MRAYYPRKRVITELMSKTPYSLTNCFITNRYKTDFKIIFLRQKFRLRRALSFYGEASQPVNAQ